MFDDRDLRVMIDLAVYLEDKVERGTFPRARFKSYSMALARLIYVAADSDGAEDDEEFAHIVIDALVNLRPAPAPPPARKKTKSNVVKFRPKVTR